MPAPEVLPPPPLRAGGRRAGLGADLDDGSDGLGGDRGLDDLGRGLLAVDVGDLADDGLGALLAVLDDLGLALVEAGVLLLGRRERDGLLGRLGLDVDALEDDLHACLDRGRHRRGDDVGGALGDSELGEHAEDRVARRRDAAGLAVDHDADLLGGGHREGEPVTPEGLRAGCRENGTVGADVQVVEGTVDRGGRGPVLLRLTVDGHRQEPAVAHGDAVTVTHLRVERGHDVVVGADGDVLLLEDIGDGAAEDVHRGRLPVDGDRRRPCRSGRHRRRRRPRRGRRRPGRHDEGGG